MRSRLPARTIMCGFACVAVLICAMGCNEAFWNGFASALDEPAKDPSRETAVSQIVVESTIDGQFDGWDGHTSFEFVNGQIWVQDEYSYVYHYAYRPTVVVYETSGGYRLKVQGVDKTVKVRRIK